MTFGGPKERVSDGGEVRSRIEAERVGKTGDVGSGECN